MTSTTLGAFHARNKELPMFGYFYLGDYLIGVAWWEKGEHEDEGGKQCGRVI